MTFLVWALAVGKMDVLLPKMRRAGFFKQWTNQKFSLDTLNLNYLLDI